MSNLALASIITGGFFAALGFWLAWRPALAAAQLARFPRSATAGRVLTAIALVWTVVELTRANINWVDEHRQLIYLAVPAGWIVITTFMEELLAARAVGGILLLAPMPLLDAAFLSDSAWRLVIVVSAYLMAIAGMILVWSPYLFRKTCERWLTTPRRYRYAGGISLGYAVILISLGMFVY